MKFCNSRWKKNPDLGIRFLSWRILGHLTRSTEHQFSRVNLLLVRFFFFLPFHTAPALVIIDDSKEKRQAQAALLFLSSSFMLSFKLCSPLPSLSFSCSDSTIRSPNLSLALDRSQSPNLDLNHNLTPSLCLYPDLNLVVLILALLSLSQS